MANTLSCNGYLWMTLTIPLKFIRLPKCHDFDRLHISRMSDSTLVSISR